MMKFLKGLTIFLILVFGTLNAFAQTTAFSYQGRLSEAGAPVTGSRLFQFTLFDENGAAIPGAVISQTLTVTNGVFNTNLDFGAAAFPGANRSLEIAVKINAGDAYTILNPRQTILAAPYSTKSKTADTATNAAQLGGVDSTRFIKSDTGGNVSLNGNLSVSGTTTFDTVNAATQFNLGGQRVLASDNSGNLILGNNAGNLPNPPNPLAGFGRISLVPQASAFNTFLGNFAGANDNGGILNTFVGYAAGYNGATTDRNSFFGVYSGFYNTIGSENSFFGVYSGIHNTTASSNSFFGSYAGYKNTTGSANVFIGTGSGNNNTTGNRNTFTGNGSGGGCDILDCSNITTGNQNAFHGYQSGLNISSGSRNSFLGSQSGYLNSSGSDNVFFGNIAGLNNSTGSNNTFVGTGSGNTNIIGSSNTLLGFQANVSANNLTNATALGANTVVSQSNSLILGNNANIGIGTSTPNSKLTVVGLIETTTGGVKFPDGTIQISAATGGSGILNQTTLQAGANFNIGGNGTIVGTLTAGSLFGSGANLTNLNAGNITTGTLSNARLGLIPTANIADGAVTALKIAPGQVVKSFNGLTDNVTLAAGSNITITPSGNTLTIASTGGGSGGILNQTTTQAGANFNISGNGTASAFFANFVAADDFRIGSGDSSILNSTGGVLRVGVGSGIGAGGNQNTFVGNNSGDNAGTSDNNTFAGYQSGRLASGVTGGNSFFGAFSGGGATGGFNSFFGVRSGGQTTTGSSNSFFGANSGFNNTTGIDNAFFGADAGKSNQNGNYNSFFGFKAGESNIGGTSLLNGANNAFFGTFAGQTNSNGQNNVFVGFQAGKTNSNGSENTFVGVNTGITNGGENRNTFIGANADGDAAITNATAIGNRAKVITSNSLVLGSVSGENGAAFDTQVGIGTIAPKARLDVTGGNILVGSPGQGMILKSPNGATCKLLSIDNAGAMVLAAVACP